MDKVLDKDRTPDIQLDVLALVRARGAGDDAAFNELVKRKTARELKELLSASAAFSALVIPELLEKLAAVISRGYEGEIPEVSLNDFLDGVIRTIFDVPRPDVVS